MFGKLSVDCKSEGNILREKWCCRVTFTSTKNDIILSSPSHSTQADLENNRRFHIMRKLLSVLFAIVYFPIGVGDIQ